MAEQCTTGPTTLDKYYDMIAYIDYELTRPLYRLLVSELNFTWSDGRVLVVAAGPSASEWLGRLAPLVTRALTYAGFQRLLVNPSAAQRAELSLDVIETREVQAQMVEA